MSCSLPQHYGSTHQQVYQSVCLESELSAAQIARRHFLLIGFCETPRAKSRHSLHLRGLCAISRKLPFIFSYCGRTQKCCIRSKGGREPNVTDAAECRNVRFRGVDKIARKFRPTAAIHRVPSWRSATSQDKPFMHPTAFDDGHNALHQKPWRRSSSAISVLDAISRVGKAAK